MHSSTSGKSLDWTSLRVEKNMDIMYDEVLRIKSQDTRIQEAASWSLVRLQSSKIVRRISHVSSH